MPPQDYANSAEPPFGAIPPQCPGKTPPSAAFGPFAGAGAGAGSETSAGVGAGAGTSARAATGARRGGASKAPPQHSLRTASKAVSQDSLGSALQATFQYFLGSASPRLRQQCGTSFRSHSPAMPRQNPSLSCFRTVCRSWSWSRE